MIAVAPLPKVPAAPAAVNRARPEPPPDEEPPIGSSPVSDPNPAPKNGPPAANHPVPAFAVPSDFADFQRIRPSVAYFLFTNPGNNTYAQTAVNITGFTLNVGENVTASYSGAIGGFGASPTTPTTGGASTLTKTGAGTQVLSGTSTYTGATLVSAGTLLVNGSLGNTVVEVNGGAFGGTGAIGSTLDLVAGSFHVVDLADALQVAGTVSIYAGFGIADLAGITWGSVLEGTYTLIDGTLGGGVFDGLANNSVGTAYDIGGGRTAYFQEGSLQLVVIPEPSAAVLLGAFGTLALLRRRRA